MLKIVMTDEELMLAVCKGDRSAYQAIVKQHLKPISHYAFRFLGNQKDTEDIAQEVFLKLWMNASSWKSEKSKLTTWLHRITHNLCIDYLRKHARVSVTDTSELISDQLDSTNSFATNTTQTLRDDESDEFNEDEKMKVLISAMNSLPENQRSALMLCHYQNFSNIEAADIMQISVKALESCIARAKRSLRKQFAGEEKQNQMNKPLPKKEASILSTGGRNDI